MSDDARRVPVVLICAKGHPAVTFLARRDEPEPPCPICGRLSAEKEKQR